MIWLWVFIAGAAAFFALGWPAEALAQDQSKRAGASWFLLTFAAPVVAWFIVGLIAQSRNESSEVAFGFFFILGSLSSVAAIVLGTLTARTTRRRRPLRRL